eukprot:m.249415 g.249415  ORF g.249415 m.249415 type:complete len:890 (+) comp19522_c0_seq2:16-2685(+)
MVYVGTLGKVVAVHTQNAESGSIVVVSQSSEFDRHTIHLWFLDEHTVRIRVVFACDRPQPPDESSYILLRTCWDDQHDDLLSSERTRQRTIIPDVVHDDRYVHFRTPAVTLRLCRENTCFRLSENATKRVLYEDLADRPYEQDHMGRRFHRTVIDMDEHFYGLGETTGPLNKANRKFRLSPHDAIGHDPVHGDPLYKHIPFMVRLRRSGGVVGMFYHNTFEGEFQTGCEISGYWPRYAHYMTEGGDIDVFMIAGPRMKDVIRRYCTLTGTSAMLPRNALGYIGSSMYYPELKSKCDEGITSFVRYAIEKKELHMTNFHLSSGYTSTADNKRCVFHWNQNRFPSPSEFFASLRDSYGVVVSPNVKPGILLVHPDRERFDPTDFVTHVSGTRPYVDTWWGGKGTFVDFTNPHARQVWATLLKERLLDLGVVSIWNDNNEYECVRDRRSLCHGDGSTMTMAQAKPIHANLMAWTAVNAIKDVHPSVRPYVISRSGFAGIQRYAQTWAGDNHTSWATLKYNVALILGIGLCGVANHGCDIGGFHGPRPSAELLVRWVQAGVFQPRFSIHSSNNDNTVTEPWMYGEPYTTHIRQAIQLRELLMPMWYSLMYNAHCHGDPIVRPLVYEFTDDARCWDIGDEVMLGESVLVASVLEQGSTQRAVYLPSRDTTWYEWRSRTPHAGAQTLDVAVDLSSIPMFIRGGSVVPTSVPTHMSAAHPFPVATRLVIAPDSDCEFVLYQDDGVRTLAATASLRTHVRVTAGARVEIDLTRTSTEGVADDLEHTMPGLLRQVSTSDVLFQMDVISPQRGAFWCTVERTCDDGTGVQSPATAMRQFLIAEELEAPSVGTLPSEGWMYMATENTVRVQLMEREGQSHRTVTHTKVVMSFDDFNLIGM